MEWDDVKEIKKNGASKGMHKDASPSQMSQQDGGFKVNATGSAGSPAPSEHFGVRMTMDGAAIAHLSCSVFPNSLSPYNSETWHCLCVQVTHREGQVLNPLPKCAWTGSIVTNVFSEIKDLTQAVVLALEQAVLFFGRQS